MNAETLCVRQSWTRKRTRHTRRLAKRFIRLESGVLKSYKKAPFDSNSCATCQWNVVGSSLTVGLIPNHPRNHWQLILVCGQEETIEFVFDQGRLAERWAEWLSRASLHGSLHASLALLPYRDVLRTIRGAELPGYLRPMAYALGDSNWTREMEVTHTGTLRSTFIEFELIPDLKDAKNIIAYVLLVDIAGAEAHIRFKTDPLVIGECLGGTAEISNVSRLLVKVPILGKLERMDVLTIKLYRLTSTPPDSNIFQMISKAATGNRNLGACIPIGKWSLPLSDINLYLPSSRGASLTISGEPIEIRRLRCSMPWWHVFDTITPESGPLSSEFSLSSWSFEASKLTVVFNRLCEVFSSADWLSSFEQPPATFVLITYVTACCWFWPAHFCTLIILVPLCAFLILRCPYLDDVQFNFLLSAPIGLAVTHINSLRWNCPKDLKANKQSILTSPSPLRELMANDTLPATLRSLIVTAGPIEQDIQLHQGLLTKNLERTFFTRPYIERSLKGLVTLGLVSIYGGLPSSNISETKEAFKILRETPAQRRMVNPFKLQSEPESFGHWLIKRLSLWQDCHQTMSNWHDLCLPLLAVENNIPNKDQITTFQRSTSSAATTSEIDDAWDSMSQESSVTETDIVSHPNDNHGGLRHPFKQLQEKRPYWRFKDLSEIVNGPGLFPSDAAETGADSGDEDEIVLAQQLSRHRQRKGGGIRGVVRDAASVFRVIIEYRRNVEKGLNLFSWAHPLATMTITGLLILVVIMSPWISWPLLFWFDALSNLRRLYQKAAWKRTAHMILQTQYAIAQAAKYRKMKDRCMKGNDVEVDTLHPADLVETVIAGSEDFAKGSARLPASRGWIWNIIDHTLYFEEVAALSGMT